jgi:hypothetical protein
MVSIDEITNRGKGQEWTCVFSIAGELATGFDPEVSLETNFNRLVGYRMQIDGMDQGLTSIEIGTVGRFLPALDEQTKNTTEISLKRRSNVLTTISDFECENVLCYACRLQENSPHEMCGLSN